jgi:L-asparaginase II
MRGSSNDPLVVRTVRSGLTESLDDATAVVVDADGRVLASWGDPDTPLYYRSAIKPIQATVSQELGAALLPEHLAVACSSHSGHPVHVAIVRAMLRSGGLTEADLGTPPSWPLAEAAKALLLSTGHRAPLPVYHNCSGKHAGFLLACVAQGWPVDTYRSPDHPLQRRVLATVAEATGQPVEPVGIDGCGAPTLRGSCRGLATAFAAMTVDRRFAEVASATSRFPSLVAGNERPDGRLGAWWGGPLKAGAEGLIGAARHGVGIAAKSRSGSSSVAVMAMIEVMRSMGLLSGAALEALQDVATPPVLGGGDPVGSRTVDGSA